MTRDHVAAARAVYDVGAENYVEFVGTEISPATEAAVDRAMLHAFVDLVTEGTTASVPRVADVGCGPGRVAALLAAHGLDVVGFDVSLAMVAAARAAHPAIRFEEGRLDDLPVEDGSLAGAVCWYSIIYTPTDELGDVFTELRRVLGVGGYLLLAFQAGDDETVVRDDAHRTGLPLTNVRHSPRTVTDRLGHAGLEVCATTLREPEFDHETSAQAFVIARNRA